MPPNNNRPTRSFSKQEIIEQLAYLDAGILWPGTVEDVFQSLQTNRDPDGNRSVKATTVDKQLASMTTEESREYRRRFRKLWRAGRSRVLAGVTPVTSLTRGLLLAIAENKRQLTTSEKSQLARFEALELFKEKHGNDAVTISESITS